MGFLECRKDGFEPSLVVIFRSFLIELQIHFFQSVSKRKVFADIENHVLQVSFGQISFESGIESRSIVKERILFQPDPSMFLEDNSCRFRIRLGREYSA